MARTGGSKQQAWVTRTGSRASVTSDAERELEVGKGFKLSEVALSDVLLQQDYTSKTTQAVSPNGNQVFRYLSLWGNISHSNHHIR